MTTQGEPAPAPPVTEESPATTVAEADETVTPAPEPAETVPLVDTLQTLRGALLDARYPLQLASAAPAAAAAAVIARQLDDYLLPRLGALDAPLLVVVGGSTGAGKSTLVNSLVRAPVSPAGVLRPTTRAPVLVCHQADATWFTSAQLLPGLARTASHVDDPRTLQVVTAPALDPGLALLDAPDIDSVVDSNRALAAQLLAAADLWLFVTTASRYADAVPWDMLHNARARGTSVALVLDRVPEAAREAVGPHLTTMLQAHQLGAAELFVLSEARLDGQGLLPDEELAELRDWLSALARSASARAEVVRQTVEGAIAALEPAVAGLAEAADEQVAVVDTLTAAVRTAYRGAASAVEHGVRDGVLLRGEVLARWQELVGTGDVMRALQARIGRVRDRVTAAITGRITPGERFQAALESGLVALIRSAAADAAEQAATAWRLHPAGEALLRDGHGELATPAPDLSDRVERLVRDWQRALLELVRTEAGEKRAIARVSAYAINGTGLLVMISIFAATSFIPTGAEIAVAGGTTVAAQKVLEAIFGDQAVRALANRAREDLLDRVQALYAEEAARFTDVLTAASLDPATANRLRDAAAAVATAHSGSESHAGGPRTGAAHSGSARKQR